MKFFTIDLWIKKEGRIPSISLKNGYIGISKIYSLRGGRENFEEIKLLYEDFSFPCIAQ